MLLGGPQNTIKSHLVFTALFCFAPFSVFSSRMSAPYLSERKIVGRLLNASSFSDLSYSPLQSCSVHASRKIRFGLILCPSFPPPYSNAKN
jgi:hypothetical protein